MRVGISLLTLEPGAVGGSETYARSLCRALADVGTHEYRVFAPDRASDVGGPLPTRVVSSFRSGESPLARLVGLGAACMSRRVRREMRLDEVDGLHFPLTTTVPPVREPPAVVTIHDVQHLVMPQFFSRATLLYRRLAYEGSARRAQRVIAISGHVRETLLERVGLPSEKVVVVHSGVDHVRFTPPAPAKREPFLLYPAFPWPHKNHVRLLEAFRLLRRRHPELRLVLTGGSYEEARKSPGVEVRGFVTAEQLVALYQSASALVFPSLYEGFGQPLLEAMACGCPVAAAAAGSIPEICGGAARLFDPYEPEAIAEAVEDVLRETDRWSTRGVARAHTFSWEQTARATDGVYTALV